MPYILFHKPTSEILTCQLINTYDLPYFGTKFWEFEDEASKEVEPFLKQHQLNSEEWELKEVDESQLKLFNVKLKNDPIHRLFLDNNGKPFIRKT